MVYSALLESALNFGSQLKTQDTIYEEDLGGKLNELGKQKLEV